MSLGNAFTRLQREIGIKRCIIIDGNVDDVYFEKNRIVTLQTKLTAILQELNYQNVVFWDRIHGASGNTEYLNLIDETELEGDVYDDEEDDAEEVTPEITLDDPTQMFHVILRNLSRPNQKYAFVLNWASYLFNGSASLSDEERKQLTLLGKAINEQTPKYYFAGSDEVNESVVIIIANKLSMLPLSLYQGNPEVSTVNLSKPDRLERQKMLEKLQDSFNVTLKANETLTSAEHFQQYVDMLDDFSNREMIQLAKLSMKEAKMTFDKLFLLFKYGEKENPWEQLDYQALKNIEKTLSERVVGQDDAIARIKQVVIKAYMGLTGIHKSSSRSMPKGVLFFVGPTGVGKTELSKALAKFLFGDEQACIRFDMSEYSQENSDQKLIGAPPGYVGYEEGGQLTNAIREKPFSIILFDEIEKAAQHNPRILDIFLQILEDGRLTDSKGETVYFSESIIIFTSNLGASEIQNTGESSEIAEQFLNKVKEYFNHTIQRPELLGRIGYNNIIPFNFINDPEFSRRIAASKLVPVKKGIMEKYKFDLQFESEPEFIDYILKASDTNKGGRDILNAINDQLLDELAVFLFENKDDLKAYRNSVLMVSVNKKKKKLEFDFTDDE